MSETFSDKAAHISPASKFVSELNTSIPAEKAEMERRVFGNGFKRDTHGNPIEVCALTPEFAKEFPDRAEQHCIQVGHPQRGEGPVAEVRERKRLGRPINDGLIERAQIAEARRKKVLRDLELPATTAIELTPEY